MKDSTDDRAGQPSHCLPGWRRTAAGTISTPAASSAVPTMTGPWVAPTVPPVPTTWPALPPMEWPTQAPDSQWEWLVPGSGR